MPQVDPVLAQALLSEAGDNGVQGGNDLPPTLGQSAAQPLSMNASVARL